MLDLRKRAFLAFLAKTGLFEISRPPLNFKSGQKSGVLGIGKEAG